MLVYPGVPNLKSARVADLWLGAALRMLTVLLLNPSSGFETIDVSIQISGDGNEHQDKTNSVEPLVNFVVFVIAAPERRVVVHYCT